MNDQEFEDKFKARENRSYLKYKKVVKISIYGAFSSGRIDKLIKLRDYLRKYGYNARLSIDFEDEYPRHENESIEEYNRRLSEKLNDWGDIHIFVFFYEREHESNINQSASMELERTHNLGNDRYVVLYFEKGSLEQMRTVFTGLVKKSGWDYETFEEIEDILDDAIGFCSNCIRNMSENCRESTTS